MNQVRDILQKPDTIAVFDVDGTLFSYNYGTFHAHHDLDNEADEAAFQKINMYAEARGIPIIRNYICGHGVERVFCLSMEPHGHEAQKAAALEKYYGIPLNHCVFVKRSEEKPAELLRLAERLHVGEHLVYIDDNELVLRLVERQTPFPTAHVTIFFEDI